MEQRRVTIQLRDEIESKSERRNREKGGRESVSGWFIFIYYVERVVNAVDHPSNGVNALTGRGQFGYYGRRCNRTQRDTGVGRPSPRLSTPGSPRFQVPYPRSEQPPLSLPLFLSLPIGSPDPLTQTCPGLIDARCFQSATIPHPTLASNPRHFILVYPGRSAIRRRPTG